EPIDFESLSRYDVIGVTGMIVQGDRMCEILVKLKTLPATIVVGGPYVSVAEDAFAGLCDVRFVGEAERTWPVFLNTLGFGEQVAERYEQTERTDMHTVPAPRYDLVKAARYELAWLQFWPGGPFPSNFSETSREFAPNPRRKTSNQRITGSKPAGRPASAAGFS